MLKIVRTAEFNRWIGALRDRQAKVRILVRIDRLASGNPGQTRSLAGGVEEMKIDYGPGYRVYYTRRGNLLVVMLCGGNKKTQQQDIEQAMRMARSLEV